MRKVNNYESKRVFGYFICWHVLLENGIELCLTDCEHDIEVDEVKYLAKSLLSYTEIRKNAEMLEDTNEITGIIDNKLIKEADILNGKFDNALLSIYLTNNQNLEQILLK
ncbi:baseplate hub domain-containing protein [Candidatus Bandiella euplotis]|uniref:DUF2163 N-terminal domain-containing protein n=1 Tax=Candidatus Bandiella euplotis TaxID=1664265 RepID=A0ABZ0UMB1_9RICK|nr:DUF2163 domain-containing protein [Candidatus Bandiella woodruffii]WPX96862.1 DUF2163 N-terminal domain-containing protein [Candidatus Bandiella woodruffii]